MIGAPVDGWFGFRFRDDDGIAHLAAQGEFAGMSVIAMAVRAADAFEHVCRVTLSHIVWSV